MALPLDFLQGMSRPVNWYRDYVIKACDACDMTCEHVSRQGELWSFFPCALDLSLFQALGQSGRSKSGRGKSGV